MRGQRAVEFVRCRARASASQRGSLPVICVRTRGARALAPSSCARRRASVMEAPPFDRRGGGRN
eukprot:6878627-Lingulodinium_polyedra.AAC.1